MVAEDYEGGEYERNADGARSPRVEGGAWARLLYTGQSQSPKPPGSYKTCMWSSIAFGFART